jgi:protoporphyrinogen oxidase
MAQVPYIIIGGGLTGLAAGSCLGKDAIVFEKDNRPGGLVKTHCFDDGYWFDHVLHIFHCNRPDTLNKISNLPGMNLTECPPIAWIETAAGTVRYPFQLNLGGLSLEARKDCLKDFAAAYYQRTETPSASYREFLQRCFGEAMCKLFYFPYNEKMWKYPLEQITSTGQTWNLHQPSIDEILQGIFEPNHFRETYNTHAFYPRPAAGAALRGMEVLSAGLSKRVHNLRLSSTVLEIDPDEHTVLVKEGKVVSTVEFEEKCLVTIPLPHIVKMCKGASVSLLRDMEKLVWNKVLSVALSIKGPRPVKPGHWRYYTNPDIPFSRLIFMTEFDPCNAPEDGWGLLVEITVPGNEQQLHFENIKARVLQSLYKLDVLDDKQTVIGTHHWLVDPAYVVFTHETEKIAKDCIDFLTEKNIVPSGRYGNWEYSSMSKNLEDGFKTGELWAQQTVSNI